MLCSTLRCFVPWSRSCQLHIQRSSFLLFGTFFCSAMRLCGICSVSNTGPCSWLCLRMNDMLHPQKIVQLSSESSFVAKEPFSLFGSFCDNVHRRPSRSMWSLIRWTRYACSSRTGKFVASTGTRGMCARDLYASWSQTKFMKRCCILWRYQEISIDIMRSWRWSWDTPLESVPISMNHYGRRGSTHARRKISELWVMKLMERWRERMSLLRPISFVRFDVRCSMFWHLQLWHLRRSSQLDWCLWRRKTHRPFKIPWPISLDQCTFHDSFLVCLQYWLHLMCFWCSFPPSSLTFSWFCHVFFHI